MAILLKGRFKNVEAQMELSGLGSYHYIVIRQNFLGMPNGMNKIACQPGQDPPKAAEEDQESHASPGPRRHEPSKL